MVKEGSYFAQDVDLKISVDVIIDGGSIDNLVSKMMVTKLNLKTLKYPHPYHIS